MIIITPKGAAGGRLGGDDRGDYIETGIYDRGNRLIGHRRVYLLGTAPVDIYFKEEDRPCASRE